METQVVCGIQWRRCATTLSYITGGCRPKILVALREADTNRVLIRAFRALTPELAKSERHMQAK